MAINVNDALANSILAGIQTIFDGGTLEFRTGSRPATAGAAATGTVVASITLPTPSFATPASRSMAKAGTWEDTSADASGTIGYARMKNTGDTQRIDFTVTATGGGGDIQVDNTVLAAGQDFKVTAATIAYP